MEMHLHGFKIRKRWVPVLILFNNDIQIFKHLSLEYSYFDNRNLDTDVFINKLNPSYFDSS